LQGMAAAWLTTEEMTAWRTYIETYSDLIAAIERDLAAEHGRRVDLEGQQRRERRADHHAVLAGAHMLALGALAASDLD